MADTADTTKAGGVVQVTYSNAGADWNYSTNGGYTSAMHVRAIIWYPTANNDKLIINEGGIDGPSIVQWEAEADNDTKQIVFGSPGVKLHPYIDFSDCVFGTVTSTKIIFIID